MDIKKEIKKHERCIELLEAMRTFKNLINLNRGSINGFPGTFPELRRKYLHRIDIQERSIARLELIYKKVLSQ